MSCQPQVVHFGGSCVCRKCRWPRASSYMDLAAGAQGYQAFLAGRDLRWLGRARSPLTRCFWTGLGTRKGILPQGLGARAVSLVNQRFPYRPYKLGQQGSLSVCAMCQLGALGLLGTLNEGLLCLLSWLQP